MSILRKKMQHTITNMFFRKDHPAPFSVLPHTKKCMQMWAALSSAHSSRGLIPVGSSAPSIHLLTPPSEMGRRTGRVKLRKLVGFYLVG